MGVNLVPIARHFSIATKAFTADDADVHDGCIDACSHRLLRFESLVHNQGDTDLVLGDPALRPDLFEIDVAHDHYHLKEFTAYALFDSAGNPVSTGVKLGLCFADIEHLSAWGEALPQFMGGDACNVWQGISTGWADLYQSNLPCQFIVIDDLPDGDYTFVFTINAASHVPEDRFDDNTSCYGLRIAGDVVTEIPLPIHVSLLTPTVAFGDVPVGLTALQEITFAVRSCHATTFQIFNGPRTLVPEGGSVEDPESFGAPFGFTAMVDGTPTLEARQAHLWISYTATSAGDVDNGFLGIRLFETGEEWAIWPTATSV